MASLLHWRLPVRDTTPFDDLVKLLNSECGVSVWVGFCRPMPGLQFWNGGFHRNKPAGLFTRDSLGTRQARIPF
jgi:hypothetical protein